MKTTFFKNGLTLLTPCLIVLLSVSALAQDKTQLLTTKFKPEDLTSYKVDEAASKIDLLFIHKGRKEDVYNNFSFSTDFKLLNSSEEELEKEKAKSKFSFWDAVNYSSGGGVSDIIKDNVLTVENNITLSMSLKKGYIGSVYWKHPMTGNMMKRVAFVARETVKAKTADDRKLTLAAFKTDAPSEYFASSFTMNADNAGMSAGKKTIGGKSQTLSDASGDVLILATLSAQGILGPKGKEMIPDNWIKFVAQRYSASTLEKTAETAFEIPYHSEPLYRQDATDGSGDLIVILAPAFGVKKYMNPNKQEYVYIRIAKDASIKENFTFECPFSRLNNIAIHNDGNETYIIGTGDESNNGKYFPFIAVKQNDKQIAIIKLKEGKKEFSTTLPVANLKGLTANIGGSKAEAYDGKGLILKGFLKLQDNSIFINGQGYTEKEGTKTYGDFYGFTISPTGIINKHYVIERQESNKASEGELARQLIFMPKGKNIMMWTAFEYTKRGDAYPKYTNINLINGSASALAVPGNKQFFVNENFPAYVYTDNSKMFFFGNDEGNKQLWMHTVTF
jgi:hypothetical protein